MDQTWFTFYSFYSNFLERLFVWIPFPLGDLYIIGLVVMLVIRLSMIGIAVRARSRKNVLRSFFQTCYLLAFVYFQFLISWGLNYYYRSFEREHKFHPVQSEAELKSLVAFLIVKCANERRVLNTYRGDVAGRDTVDMLFRKATEVYTEAEPHLEVYNRFPIVKASLFSGALNYLGTEGYYNPFTGEAQVNSATPRCLVPFNCCHELSHQAGYSFEYEASLISYLVCTSCKDHEFRYSGYFSALLEALPLLYSSDSIYCRKAIKTIDPLVRGDLKTVYRFNRRYSGFISRLTGLIYGRYLKANRQPQGLQSYSDFIPLLSGWYEKMGYPESFRIKLDLNSLLN